MMQTGDPALKIAALQQRMSLLCEAVQRINEDLDFDHVLQGVIDSARILTGARQGVIVCYEDPEAPAAVEAVVAQMRGNHQIFASRKRRMYGDHWRSLPGRRHQRWLRRLDELGVLDTTTETD